MSRHKRPVATILCGWSAANIRFNAEDLGRAGSHTDLAASERAAGTFGTEEGFPGSAS